MEGVHYMHSLKIGHRDLKTENLVVTDKRTWQIKLIDLGLSKAHTSLAATFAGTVELMAPEVAAARGEGYDALKVMGKGPSFWGGMRPFFDLECALAATR